MLCVMWRAGRPGLRAERSRAAASYLRTLAKKGRQQGGQEVEGEKLGKDS